MEVGLEVFLGKEHRKYQKLRLGVLCNQASIDRNLRHISETILDKKLKLNVTCFIGPQHGIRGEKQDNMIESEDFTDPKTGLPVFSLYGVTREPNEQLLGSIDAFVIDLQDIGTRIYTFMYTMANCMRAAARTGKKVVVLDRPNPINGVALEGNVLEPKYASFVGQFPMCVRHGMTMGELAVLFNEAFGIGCDLDIVKLKGWKRASFARDWKRDWAPPSPNIPTGHSTLLFPGTVFFEGTNVSEGRGTTKPFEWIGAPFIEPDPLAKELNGLKLPGIYYRPIYFQPTFHKGKDQICGGVQLHVTDASKLNAFRAGIHLLEAIYRRHTDKFEWKKPPYEYVHDQLPIDVIAGSASLREAIEAGRGLKSFEARTKEELAAYRKVYQRYLIYKRG